MCLFFQLVYNIVNGLRPSLEGIPDELQQLIVDCWNEVPQIRPSFTEIVLRLQRLKNLTAPDKFSSFPTDPAVVDDNNSETATPIDFAQDSGESDSLLQ